MEAPLLQTKLYIPPVRTELMSRSRLIERLNGDTRLGHRQALISAPASYDHRSREPRHGQHAKD